MKRLIDANAFKKHLHKDPLYPLVEKYGMDGVIDAQPTVDAVPVSELQEVEKERDYWMDKAHSYEQTILRLTVSTGEVPVRHGKWIETDESDEWCGRFYKCSNCNTFVIGDMDNYCPYCGARMDEE